MLQDNGPIQTGTNNLLSKQDAVYMAQAFEQAQKALGHTLPNPAVGAVVMHNQQIVGKGHTQPAGGAHAEVKALEQAGALAQGATMYVTLEPCCHYGRTPPCTLAIQNAGIACVVIAVLDPNPIVHGKGVQALMQSGIQVRFWDENQEIAHFYQGFACYMQKGRPLIELKMAQSLDGFVAGLHKEPVQISGAQAQKWMHGMRAYSNAVLVGGGTLRSDNPRLTVRFTTGACDNTPLRVALLCQDDFDDFDDFQNEGAKGGGEPWPEWEHLHLHNASLGPSLVFVPRTVANTGAQQIVVNASHFDQLWQAVLAECTQRGMHRILVETGPRLLAAILKTGVWDAFYLLTGSLFLEKGYSWREKLPNEWKNTMQLSTFEALGSDFLTVFTNSAGNGTSFYS
jgi:diaminohydroxyphosphoribosylaminopyrimidine deaminase / 5-amino-6-(5-phosphoribosylamino)uracil reductase